MAVIRNMSTDISNDRFGIMNISSQKTLLGEV